MSNTNPTIVQASLDDKELQASINKMVANFDKGLQTMLEHSNEYVGKIQTSLQKIGDTNFGAKGSNDGAVVKQTKAQNDFTDAVKRSTNEIKRQGKEGEMSFDQIAAALSKARQTVSEFNTKRASGILPSSEDYKRYEQALARIVEYNDKLKQSAIGMANANERWFGNFNAKRINEVFLPSNKTLSDMKAFYQEQEKNDQKRLANIEKERAAREKMIESARKAEQKYQDTTLKSAFRGALALPTNNIDELRYKIERIATLTSTLRKEGLIDEAQVNRANAAVAKLNEQLNKQLATEKEVKAVQSQQVQPQVKSARDSYIAFMQGYKEQANQLTQLIQNEENRLVQAQQSRVTALGQQIDQNKTKIQELREQMQQLAQEEKNAPSRYGVKDAYRAAIQQTNDEINKLIAKNKELEAEQQKVASTDPLKQQNATLDELRAKRDKVLNIMREETSSTQQQTQAQQQATQSAQRHTQEIRKQAQAIRESQQWKEKGFVTVDGNVFSNQENIAKKKRISLEEQILNLQRQGIYLSQNQTTKEWQLVDASGRRIAFIQQENENLAKQRERVAEIANDVRRLFADGSFGKISFTPSPLSGVRYIYQENDERSKGLTIEQQIEKILKEQNAEYERQASIKKASNNGSQRTLNDLQSQARAIEELLEKGKRVKALGGFEFIPADMSGQTVMQQIISYQEQRKAGLLAENQALNLQLELSNAIAQAQGRIAQEQEKRKNYIQPTATDDYQQVLRNAIANNLGIDASKVINADAQYDSIKRVNNALKQLQDAYARMTNEERNSPVGKQMIRQMQELERQTQQLRAQISRPISLKDAMGLSEKTLDDIAYKMRQLASYRSGLNVDTQEREIQQVNHEYNRLKKRMDEVMQKNQQMIASNTALGRSWNYMKNRLAFYFTVGASTQFIKNLIDIRGQYELLERSIGILIDSAQNGSQIFAELNSMAIKSPFTTMELGAAAKQLVAYDVAAKDVVDTTRRLADMAAAVGIPIERLTYALGQIKAYGYLNARDARMFANAGIPLVKELADRYTELEGRLVSTADVYDRIKKKAISYEDVMATVNKMTDEGGKFFNFQEKAADTLKVRIANLTLAWNNMMNEMGAANQSVLSSGLKTLSDVFKNWRSIYNLITSIIVTFGVLKATQVVVLTKMAMLTKKNITLWAALEFSMRKSIGAAVVNNLRSIGSLLARFSNPLSLAAAVVTALGVAIGKAVLDYKDLIAANEAFNKSISDNAKENIESIEKFFEDYKKQLSNIGGLNNADQEKLWERIQEEIEKTTKNAEDYIRVLNNVEDVSSRIRLGEDVLEQSKTIQREIQRLADSGTFSIGGGFANDSAAKNLQNYQEALNEIRQEYGSVNAAIEAHTMKSRKLMADYTTQRNEVRAELNDFVSKLDNAYMPEILGQSNDVRIQMANLRSFAESLRDAFIATEEGSKIGADGIVLLNNAIDKWITKQGVANNLIVNANGYFDGQRAKIEENKTAWEEFFRYISKKDREYLDAAIKTNNIGSDEVKKIWDKAAEEMSKRATTSYNLIQDQIAQLRNTPDIVINVVYRNEKEKLDKDQEEFEKKYIQPKDWGVLSTDEYIKQEKANREKYGTLMRKQGEDTAEYEKRISDERKKNLELSEKNGKIIEENKNKTSKYSIAVTELADKEKKAADDRLKVIKEIEKDSGYDFSTKSERTAAKQAESELAKALKDELSTIDKVRSIYKDLTNEGMSHANAVERATRGWDETVNAINKVLQKNGLQKLDLSKFAGIENPRELVNMLQSQLNTLLKRGAKPAEIKELQTKIQTLNVDAEKYDLTKITKGLNNELGKLKDEYELAVELDADPELGGIFADYMGIDLKELPKNAEEAAKKAQQYIDKILRENNSSENINIASLMGKDAFDKWIKSSGHSMEDGIVKVVDNYRQALYKMQVDESKKQMQEWEKLLEKYAEYEYKVTQIQKEAERERETARKKGASQEILDAINNREKQELARVSFEEFQKSPEWITATGDLANMSKSAIGMLIKQLEKYKRSAKNLSPKQIKQLNNALSKLYKEQRKNNPFKAISNMLDEAKERMATFDEDIKKTQEEIDNLTEKKKESIVEGVADEETDNKLKKAIKRLKELKDAREKSEEIDASSWVSSIQETIGAVQQGVNVFNDLAKAIKGVDKTAMDDVFTVLEKGGQGAATGAQIGGGYGAIIGAVAGVATSLIQVLSSASNEKITEQIKDSELAVERLELAYIDLQKAVDKAYGTSVIGAKTAAAAAKKLELQELERQLRLEQSRDSKYKDDSRIVELQKQIKELKYEIHDMYTEVVNDLMGTDVASFAENLVSAMVDAFKHGEDAMKVFNDKFDELIDNMIMKSLMSRIVSSYIDKLWEEQEQKIKARSKKESDEYADAQAEYDKVKNMTSDEWIRYHYGASTMTGATAAAIKETGLEGAKLAEYLKNLYEHRLDALEVSVENANKALNDATAWTDKDILDVVSGIENLKGGLYDNLYNAISQWYTFGEDSDKNLSALQQGIQGITEDTAGALEAYMNGVSQQVYYQSDLLTQIRDAVVGIDIDVQVATQAQMLLQLQQSYTVQMAIQGILEGVLNPSGRAFSVELLS